MTSPIPGPYRFEIHASVIWVTILVLLASWLWGMSILHDRAAQSACESVSEQVNLNDGCQR